jgi:Holliday junction resolvase RusA-like endonuclease
VIALRLTVPGPPVPKGRARGVTLRNGRRMFITPKRTLDYEAEARAEIAAAVAAHRGAWPLDARYEVELVVHFGTRRRCDLDNAAKSILDAANGYAWADDSQVDRLVVVRAYDKENPRVEVRIGAHTTLAQSTPAQRELGL